MNKLTDKEKEKIQKITKKNFAAHHLDIEAQEMIQKQLKVCKELNEELPATSRFIRFKDS